MGTRSSRLCRWRWPPRASQPTPSLLPQGTWRQWSGQLQEQLSDLALHLDPAWGESAAETLVELESLVELVLLVSSENLLVLFFFPARLMGELPLPLPREEARPTTMRGDGDGILEREE